MKTYTEEEQNERDQQAEDLHAIKDCPRLKNATTFHDVCKKIKADNQAMRHHGRLIDHYSACAFLAVYDALKKPELQKQLFDIAETNPLRAISICFKLVK